MPASTLVVGGRTPRRSTVSTGRSLRGPAARPGGASRRTRPQFLELMRGTPRDHMVSDVPLGVMLSGGLDSSPDHRADGRGLRTASEDLLDRVRRGRRRQRARQRAPGCRPSGHRSSRAADERDRSPRAAGRRALAPGGAGRRPVVPGLHAAEPPGARARHRRSLLVRQPTSCSAATQARGGASRPMCSSAPRAAVERAWPHGLRRSPSARRSAAVYGRQRPTTGRSGCCR